MKFVLLTIITLMDCFQEAITKYDNASLDDPIPIEQTDLDCFQGLVEDRYADYEVFFVKKNKKNVVILFNQIYGAGPGGNDLNLFCYTRNGKLLESGVVGVGFISGSAIYTCETIFLNDSIFQVKNIRTDRNSKNKTISYSYYLLNNEGYLEITKGRSFKGHLFQASFRIYNIEELRNLCQEDLDIMRNEMFARYGYRFKTEKWQNYFKGKSWYKPMYDEVINMFTEVEVINLYNILEVGKE